MKFELPYSLKMRLFNELIKEENPFGLNDQFSRIDFLKPFTSLKEINSGVEGFSNAYDEFYDYVVNRKALRWFDDEAILDRFQLISNSLFFKFLVERIISKGTEIKKSSNIAIVNRIIVPFNYYLEINYEDDGPNYIIQEDKANNLDIATNLIEFNVVGKNENIRNISANSFILRISDWDDYGYETSFSLLYKNETSEMVKIGGIKILKLGERTTSQVIENSFTSLSEDYCSMFIEDSSYFKLQELFEDDYISILHSLNDVAYFPHIYERFEGEEGFVRSIFRDEKESEKRVRTIKLRLKLGDITEFFKFSYLYKPVYSQIETQIDFDFNNGRTIPKRLFCLIGKNGVGKTLFLKDLLSNFSVRNSERITPNIPIYGKVMFVSFSYLDLFNDIKNTVDFNFVYSGLINRRENRPYNNNEIEINLLTLFEKLIAKNDTKKYFVILSRFIDGKLLDFLFSVTYSIESKSDLSELSINHLFKVDINKEKLSDFLYMLSSGQKALLFIITEIIVNIRYNSLLVFDEPETHLHPNAITEFMEVVMQLLEEYDSYCIIATHSPLIVREVFSDSIYVFEKDGDMPIVRKLEFETFGENLSAITNEIFGNKETSKYYLKVIEKLVNSGKSYNDIENEIKGEVPLNLNLEILIKSLIKNRDEKPT